MNGKIAFLISVLVCICAYIINPRYAHLLLNKVYNLLPNGDGNVAAAKVLTKEELATFKGENNGKVYLAIIGNVYDVTKGYKHYGPGGGYSFFAGVDGSKAYVTGKFDADGLVDDISELTTSETLALDNWKSFFDKSYTYVGKVGGAFYDINGAEKPMMKEFKKKLQAALLEKDLIENDKRLFPPCNSEWSQASGGRVWCSTRSGGVARDWVGVPRMYFTAGSSKARCACVRTSGPPSHEPDSKSHKDNGDLDNPNLSPYPNCQPASDSCPLPDTN